MAFNNLASLLAFLAAGGAALYLPQLLERFEWFQALASSGKQLTAGLAALLITLLAVGVQGLLIDYPMINERLDPYIKAGLITINILVTQFKHGSNNAALMRFALQNERIDSSRVSE